MTSIRHLYTCHALRISSIKARLTSLVVCAALIGSAHFAEARGDGSEKNGAKLAGAVPAHGVALAAKTSAASARHTASIPKERRAAPRSWRDYKKVGWRRGYVTLTNPGNGRSWKGYVLGPGDTLLPKAQQQVQAVLASWRTGRSRPIDPQLIRLIAQVSDVFGGRPIQVISGYREQSHAKDSRHKRGKALDFSIEGVPNWALRDYLRRLRHTGIGYYPNSSFVHVDVRGYPAYWIDLSRPGAPPRYVAELPKPRTGG